MKLTETIKGDDVKKFNQSLPMIVEKLRGLSNGVFTIEEVLAKNPTQGTIDDVAFISECVLILWVDTNKLYPQLVNDVYNLVGRQIQGMQFGRYPFKLGIFNIEYKDGLFHFTIDADNVSREVYNHLKYDLPTIQQILSGEYSLVIPQEELPTFFEGVSDWIKILEKRASVYYTVYKKGTIEGHTYELSDNPDIKVIVRGVKNVKTQKDLTPFIDTKFISIDGIKRSDENYDFSLEQKLIELLIKKMYDKHGVKLFIDDSVRNR